MERNHYVLVLFVSIILCLPGFVSAAPNLVGTWAGSARKVTEAACPAPIVVTVTLSQCLVGAAPGNLFKGAVKVGTVILKLVGRINADNTFEAHGSEVATGTPPTFKSVNLAGKYLPATTTAPARLQVINFSFNAGTATLPVDEMYDIFTLQK